MAAIAATMTSSGRGCVATGLNFHSRTTDQDKTEVQELCKAALLLGMRGDARRTQESFFELVALIEQSIAVVWPADEGVLACWIWRRLMVTAAALPVATRNEGASATEATPIPRAPRPVLTTVHWKLDALEA